MALRTHIGLRFILQALSFALAVAVAGLVGRAFRMMNERKDFVENFFPNGDLNTTPLFGSSLTLVILAALVVLVTTFNMAMLFLRGGAPYSKLYNVLLVFVSFALIPVNLAVTIIVARRSARVTSSIPTRFLRQVLRFSGFSLWYRDMGVVLAYTVLGWVLWLMFWAGTMAEIRTSAQHGKVKSEVQAAASNPPPTHQVSV